MQLQPSVYRKIFEISFLTTLGTVRQTHYFSASVFWIVNFKIAIPKLRSNALIIRTK